MTAPPLMALSSRSVAQTPPNGRAHPGANAPLPPSILTPPVIAALCTRTCAASSAVTPPTIVPVGGPPSKPSTNVAPAPTWTPPVTETGPTPRSHVAPAGTTIERYAPGASTPVHTVADDGSA